MYEEDIKRIVDLLKNEKVHLVALYRGSLPLGVRLSNELNAPLSIVDYQTRDGDSKKPVLIKNAGISSIDTLYIVDDIYDTGLTMNKTKEFLEQEFPNNKVKCLVLYKNLKNSHLHKNYPDVYSLRESNNEWIVFEDWEGQK